MTQWRLRKFLEDSIYVAHIVYVVVLSEKLNRSWDFACLCTLRLASSALMFPSTIFISKRKIFIFRSSSTVGMGTPRNSLRTRPHNIFSNKVIILDDSFSSFQFPRKGWARARKRHNLSLYRSVVVFSEARQLIVQFLDRSLWKTTSLRPMGTFLSKTWSTAKFVNSKNVHFVVFFFHYTTRRRPPC